MTHDARGFGTRCVHAGQEGPDSATRARAPPIYQTSSFVFEDAQHAADLYSLAEDGDVYSRFGNPTVSMLEARIADLEGGTGAVATGAGMAALDAGTSILASAGDNVVSSASIYGGTHGYLRTIGGRRGIEARFVDTLDPDAYAEAIDDDTAYVHFETIGNPSLVVPPIEAIVDVAHDHGVPVFVDNTFGTPYLCNPIEYGVDVVWESTTKWIHGSGTTIGGVLVDGGSFPWRDYPEKFPELGDESPGFSGVNFAERYGTRAFAMAAKQRSVRNLGDGQTPFDAWATIQGLETLKLRMDQHCANALAVAEYLDGHPGIAWVTYPGLPDHETHDLASKYLDGGTRSGGSRASSDRRSGGGYGGIVAFGLDGGYEASRQFCEEVELASFLANIGDAKTLVLHPASTTHSQQSAEEQRESGVTRDLVRCSVGIEEVDDVLADFDRAIDRVN